MGIDLAARPAKTAVCLLRWGADGPTVVALCRGRADDGTELHTKWLSTTAYGIRGDYGGPITKVGIDAPFGWPAPFLDAVAAYRNAPSWPTGLDNPLDDCRLRETDRAVHRRAAKWPLSVTSDKIAVPAMRCASLLTDIADRVGPDTVLRDGTGLCCEVYPDPALRWWTNAHPGALAPRESYKGPERGSRRVALLEALTERLPLKDPDRLLRHVADEDDYLDALLCALVARATELGRTAPPASELERERAQAEGWIHLPTAALAALKTPMP